MPKFEAALSGPVLLESVLLAAAGDTQDNPASMALLLGICVGSVVLAAIAAYVLNKRSGD